MRLLMLHVDFFRSLATRRGRLMVVEELNQRKTLNVGESLLALVSVERGDEGKLDEVVRKACEEIHKLAGQLNVNTVVIHPFAHLFGELSSPEAALDALKRLERVLHEKGLTVFRTPFGWFNKLELKAKGHPLSRVARVISPKYHHGFGRRNPTLNIAVILNSNDPETVWNAFRFGTVSLLMGYKVRVFLLGKGVEIDRVLASQNRYDIRGVIESFIDRGGEISACGTCLRLRRMRRSEMCSVGTMKELVEMVGKADKIVTFG